MIATSASTRLVVVTSSRVSGRQQARRTRPSTPHGPLQLSVQVKLQLQRRSFESSAGAARTTTTTTSTTTRLTFASSGASLAPPRRQGAVTTLSNPLGRGLSLFSTSSASHPAGAATDTDGCWSRGECLAAALVALMASGTLMMTSSSLAASPSTTTATAHTTVSRFPSPFSQTGGGSNGGGGGNGGSSQTPFYFAKHTLEDLNPEHVIPGETLGAPYDVSVKALKGSRLTMEDEFFVANGGRFAAVFDGHGGGGVSATLRQGLFTLVCRHLKRKKWEEHDDIASHPASISSHVAALRAAFEDMDDLVLHDDALQFQGSTAVAVVLHEGDDGHRTLLSANVGDSRAILSRKGRALDLTRDHKPNDEREKARIMAMGETIEWDQYCKVHRVRNLSLSRAIGDRFAKPVVSGEVEIKHYPVLEGDEFILLASDGLWDVMTSQDVVSFVKDRLEMPPPGGLFGEDDMERLKFTRRKNMSRYVATEAIKRGTSDNVSVLMVWLNDSVSLPPSTTTAV